MRPNRDKHEKGPTMSKESTAMYSKARAAIRRRYTVKNGYSGATVAVGLSFCDGAAIEVSDCGCYRANGHKYNSEAEMLYYFDHHTKVHFPQVDSVRSLYPTKGYTTP